MMVRIGWTSNRREVNKWDSGIVIIITEWERSNDIMKKLIFFPVEVLEPKPYKSFVVKNLYSYLDELGLTVVEEVHCDYSKVLRLKKRVGGGANE